MKIIDHGEWTAYEPERLPPGLGGQRVMFARRVSDQRDWYDFQRELRNDNIKLTVSPEGTVQATYRDASMLFPAGMRVLEVEADIDHETLRQKIYDGKIFLPPKDASEEAMQRMKAGLLLVLREFGLDEDQLRKLSKLAQRE